MVIVLENIKDNWINGTAGGAVGSGQTAGRLLWLEVQGLEIVGFSIIVTITTMAILIFMNFHLNVILKDFILEKVQKTNKQY